MATQLQVSIFLYVFTCVVQFADCDTYHIAFLGRSQSLNEHVGTIFYRTQTPGNVVFSSAVDSCTSSISPIILSAINSSVQAEVNAPDCKRLIPIGTEIAAKGIRIESDSDTVVHVYQNDGSAHAQAVEGYLAIPDQYLGNEYYVVTYCSMGGICQFAVTGITNGTTYVYVIFPDDVTVSSVCVDGVQLPSSAPAGSAVPFEITEYEVLHFESESDLTGTYIWSDYNVAVFAGARDVPTSTWSPSATSHLIEQLPPVNKWGTTFIAAPNYLNDAGDIVKIVTKDDNTVVHISGFSPFNIPTKGGFIEKRIDWQMHSGIEASNPVLIVQVMSIDIYNDTSDITGTPAMVLVPHVEQWTTNLESPFYCDPAYVNQTLIAVVSDSYNSYSIPILPAPTVFYSSWTVVDGTDYSVQMFEPFSTETVVYGPRQSTYGFCDGTAALLLRADWSWENEVCVQTAVTAGDDVDNDCDGQIDEDDCKGEDLVTTFTSQQNVSDEVTYKTVIIRGAGYVNLIIQTCDVAMVTLQTGQEYTQSMNIQISPTFVSAEYCASDDCTSQMNENITVADCTVPHLYVISWSVTAYPSTHTFRTDSEEYTWVSYSAYKVDYEQVIVSAPVGTADIQISLPQKDCKKVPRVFADTQGSQFLLPVHDTDYGFLVLLSTHANVPNTVTIELSVRNTVGQIELEYGQTKTFSNTDITENTYDKITVTANGGEISVFLFRTAIAGQELETSILPIDILGPSYNIFKHSDTNETLTGTYCDVYATTRKAQTNVGNIFLGINFELGQTEYEDLGSSHRICSDRPLSVFCGTFTDTMFQLPPIETLGKQHYIPALNLTTLSATAEVLVMAIEDSTVVTIRGDYDQMDVVDLAGDTIYRTIAENATYNITATKPVQVHLQVRSSDWASVVTIPAVEQYKVDHVFPGVIDDFIEIVLSSAVDNSGSQVSSQISAGVTSASAITHVYTDPTFSLTFLKYIHLGYDKYFIIPSDVFYSDIYEVCNLTVGTPGDGIDNDCDGLIDEEQCSDSTLPGTVDFDIDGSLNEDCASGTSTASNVLQLSIPSSMVTCPPSTGSESSTSSNSSIEIGGTNTTDDTDLFGMPNIPSSGTGQPFEAFTIVAPTVQIMSGSENEPVETCYSECMCPCGWTYPLQNYTAEELANSVAEIQEKLAVKKEELSAMIRKKTSATDDRTSATAVGIVGLVFLVVTLSTVAFLDIATLLRDIKMLFVNIMS